MSDNSNNNGVVLLAIIFITIFCACFSIETARHSQRPVYLVTYETTPVRNSPSVVQPQIQNKKIDVTDVLIALSSVMLTIFTYMLWISTEKLWKTAHAQSQDMKESLRISKMAADAADRSARSAFSSEFPFLHVEGLTADQLSSKNSLEEWISTFRPEITIKNYGRTPAFISEILMNAMHEADIPKQPEYTRFNSYPARYVIDKGETLKHTDYFIKDEIKLSEDQISELNKDDKLFIFGKIIFSDFLGEVHEKGFIFAWIKYSNERTGFLNMGDTQRFAGYEYQRPKLPA